MSIYMYLLFINLLFSINLQIFASIQPRTSPVKFASATLPPALRSALDAPEAAPRASPRRTRPLRRAGELGEN